MNRSTMMWYMIGLLNVMYISFVIFDYVRNGFTASTIGIFSWIGWLAINVSLIYMAKSYDKEEKNKEE